MTRHLAYYSSGVSSSGPFYLSVLLPIFVPTEFGTGRSGLKGIAVTYLDKFFSVIRRGKLGYAPET